MTDSDRRPSDEQLKQRAKELVAGWPPLTDEQLAKLRTLLGPVPRRAPKPP